MMNKRAQAALEFLMTYGWAILVVLAAIGALAYFGVLSPTNFVPERCVTSNAALSCAGGKAIVNQTWMAFTVHVSAGYSAVNFTNSQSATFTSSQAPSLACTNQYYSNGAGNMTTSTSALVQEDKDVTVYFTGCTGLTSLAGKRVTFDLGLKPINTQSGLPDPISVSITAKVQ